MCIKSPWPSMARTIFGDHKRYIETYLKPFPGKKFDFLFKRSLIKLWLYKGFYFTGDGALTNSEGHFQITGRVDDVINVRYYLKDSTEIF